MPYNIKEVSIVRNGALVSNSNPLPVDSIPLSSLYNGSKVVPTVIAESNSNNSKYSFSYFKSIVI
jgi:carbonic anhydrase/acetyltransferase-like protein (isoleucine patch superfamily)